MRQKKEIHHNKIEECGITKEPIDTTLEDYAIIVDCHGKEIKSVKFYKQKALKDLLQGNIDKITNEMMKKAQKMAGGVVGRMLENMGIKPSKTEVVIR